ncbi:MAG: SusC/RagA family TonB-linked outer membrane protein [Cytophagales bacterium]|tara:strand:- start:54682 stop:57681 length:3000 start_codon:yes stop_codon:yes gene_type:complete
MKTKSYYSLLGSLFFVFFFGAQSLVAQYTVSGKITDAETGDALIGVTIYDPVSGNGVASNIEGMYSVTLPSGSATLRITSVGYLTQNIEVTGSSGEEVTLDIQMKSDVANLDELVVTGLASSVKRSNLANSITKIDAEDLTQRVSPQTLDGAFQGKIPGVAIRSQSGAPGGGISVQMRGVSTLGAGSSQPLYIIDGVYVNNDVITNGRFLTTGANSSQEDNSSNRLADINPDEIASIEVLKGPSAAAIYGQRANAGVVIITTKRGKSGDTKISFSQDVGFNSALNLLGVPSWDEAKIRNYYGGSNPTADAQVAAYNAAVSSGNIFDYEEEVYGETGMISETNLSISGGNEKTTFYLTGGFRGEDGIIQKTGFERNSARLNLDHRLSDDIRVSSRSSYSFTDSQRGFTGNQNGSGGSIGYALSFIPTYAQLHANQNGEYPNNPYFSENPLSLIENATNDQTVQRFIQGIQINADLIKNSNGILSLRADGGLDYLTYNGLVHMPTFLQAQQSSANPGDVVHTAEDNINTNIQAVLSYATTVASGENEFNLNTQLGFSRFDQEQNRQVVRGQGLVSGETGIANANVQSVITQTKLEVYDLSWFAQQEVNWDDKVIGTFGGRFDRSSLNASQDEYYFFPKASLALNLTNFEFFDSDFVNQLKPRIAYGETGGLPNFGVSFGALIPGNEGGLLGTFVSNRDVDPNLQPERAQELEFGLDASVYDNRVSFEATYYIKTVEDLILDERVPTSSGFSLRARNAANLKNKGIELALNVNPIREQNLNWNSTVLFWTNESEITDLQIPAFTQGGFGTSLGGYLLQEGFSPTTIVGNPALPGEASLFTVYGDAQPDFEMSFGNEFKIYKNFDFSFLWHWKKGGENINLSLFLTDLGGTSPDWNEPTDTPGVTVGQSRTAPADYIEDSSYLKLREVGLYYTVPVATIDRLFGNSVNGIKIGASANNVLMFTDYRSYDPETSVFGTQAVNSSVEVSPFPSSRQVVFHVNIDF